MSQDIIDLLLESDLLKGVPKDALQFVADPPEWVHLKTGDTLIEQGDAGDAYYLLVQGRLRMLATNADGEVSKVGDILAGDGVGEMSLFAEQPASASVRAIHDSDLIRFSARSYIEFMANSPGAAIGVAQSLIKRLHSDIDSEDQSARFPVITVCPIDPAVDTARYIDMLIEQLGPYATAIKVTPDILVPGLAEKVRHNQRTGPEDTQVIAAALRDLQKQYDLIVYQLDYEATEWNRICDRYSDYYQFVTSLDGDPTPTENEAGATRGRDEFLRPRVDLVILHGQDFTPQCGAARWLARREIDQIHHVRAASALDFARLARFVTGHSIGLVLGSGGARGLAHIGVLRAFKEANIPIDVICGTSMGSTVAAGYAMGNSIDQITESNRKVWLQGRPTSDFTYPAIALVRGKRLHNLIRQQFGDWKIEDLPIPFFCLSGDLTNIELVHHERGELWRAVRASGSIPGLGPPLFADGRMLVDGGTINATPVDVFRQRFGGHSVLVDVSQQGNLEVPADIENVPSGWHILWRRLWPFAKSIQLPGLAEIFLRAVFLSSDRRTKANHELADVVISPPASEIGMLDFAAMDTLIEIGYGAAMRQFPEMAKGPLGPFIEVENLPDIDALPSATSLVARHLAARKQRRRWLQTIARASILAVAAGLLTGLGSGLSTATVVGVATFVVTLGVLSFRLN